MSQSEREPDLSADRGPSAVWWSLVFTGCLAISLLAYRQVLGLPLIGFDSYPLIAAARVASLADLWGLITEELMDGRYTDGHFYRPVTHATFALDHGLYGLSPLGYHLTDLVLLAACATAVAAAGVRMFGAGFRNPALLAATVILLHPLVIEVVPVPPRRADIMALLFCALLLARAPSPSAPSRTYLSGAVLAALAVGAKETGALAPFLLLALLWVEGGTARLMGSLRVSGPAFAGLAAVLAVRTAVLGGLGGHTESGLPDASTLAGLAPDYALRVLYPQPWLGTDPSLRYGTLGILAVLVAGAAWLAHKRLESRVGLAMTALWALALLAISLLSGRMHDWYAFAFLAPYGLLLACLVRAGLRAVRTGHLVRAFLLAAPAGLLLGSHLALTHALRPYGNLLQAGRLAEESLSAFDRLLAEGELGRVFQHNPWVPVLPPHSDRSEVRGLFLYGAYSMQAYADLHSELPVAVSVIESVAPTVDPERLQIVLVPAPPPHWFQVR